MSSIQDLWEDLSLFPLVMLPGALILILEIELGSGHPSFHGRFGNLGLILLLSHNGILIFLILWKQNSITYSEIGDLFLYLTGKLKVKWGVQFKGREAVSLIRTYEPSQILCSFDHSLSLE